AHSRTAAAADADTPDARTAAGPDARTAASACHRARDSPAAVDSRAADHRTVRADRSTHITRAGDEGVALGGEIAVESGLEPLAAVLGGAVVAHVAGAVTAPVGVLG